MEKESDNQYRMTQIENGIDGIIGGFIREFITKFDNFSNQIKVADVLLKAYEYRYDKIQGKLGNVNDITSTNYQHEMIFVNKTKRLEELNQKMAIIEQKLSLINTKLDNLL